MAEEQKVRLMIVIEVLGSPKEHVEKTMAMLIEKLESDKKFELVKQTTYKVEEQEIKEGEKGIIKKTGKEGKIAKLWSTFADIELITPLKNVPDICFDYMPSSIEIMEPQELKIKTTELTNLFNDIQALLHKLDRMTKDLSADNIVLRKEIDAIKSPYKMVYKK